MGDYIMKKMKYKQIVVDGKVVYEHRYIMEQHLGRKLGRYEYVHHINENTRDNRIENLVIMTPEEHNYHHIGKLPKIKICKMCGKEFKPSVDHRGRNILCSHECWLRFMKQEKHFNAKQVGQYDKNGKLIKIWVSMRVAQDNTGIHASNISKCCRGLIKTIGGYVWKYIDKER